MLRLGIVSQLIFQVLEYLGWQKDQTTPFASPPTRSVSPPVNTSDNPICPQTGDQLEVILRQELLRDRKFSLAEVISREGADFLKGESTIPRPLRAIAQINLFINQHLEDPDGALEVVLKRWIQTDSRINQHLDTPLIALEKILTSIVSSELILHEFSRQVNAQWGEIYCERPYFQVPGQRLHPKTVYSYASVYKALETLIEVLAST